MTHKQFAPIPVIIAFLAATMMILDMLFAKHLNNVAMLTFIAFQAWAMYFMAGCTIKDGIRVLLGYAGGVGASVAIMELIGWLTGGPIGMNAQIAIPLAVFIMVIPVIWAERVPMFDFVPAWFVGAGIYFAVAEGGGADKLNALSLEGHLAMAAAVLASCAWGLVYGWMTVLLRGKYEASLKKKSAK